MIKPVRHAEPKRPPIEPGLMGRMILVIEDHADSRDLLATSLRLVGARVFAVGSLTEAQRGVDRYKPDLVVCDVKLPDGSGLDFVVWLRARRPGHGREIPCLALTRLEQRVPAGRAIGFDAYMRKPVDLAKLCNVASALIGRAQPLRTKEGVAVRVRLADRVAAFLRRAQPFAYCDECIAQYFAVSSHFAQRAARELGVSEGFMRRFRRCRSCQQMGDVTWRVRPVSIWMPPARTVRD